MAEVVAERRRSAGSSGVRWCTSEAGRRRWAQGVMEEATRLGQEESWRAAAGLPAWRRLEGALPGAAGVGAEEDLAGPI
jgi:hypothetical protein